MTAAKIVVEGATYALTHRCAFRKLLLTPLTPVVHDGMLYALGRALEQTNTRMHHGVFMPNHPHLAVTSTEPNLPVFKRRFYGEVGKFIKVALAEHGFEPPERVFAEGGGHQMRLVNEAAQLAYLHYQDVNTVSAGLVEEVEQYPGFSSDLGLMNGGVLVVRRPPFYFDRGQPDEIEIPFCAPPLLERRHGSSREVVYQLRRARTDKERALAKHRTRPVLGALAVTQQHPWNEPRSPRRFREGSTPSFMVARDEELRVRCCVETTDFRRRHTEARRARLRGEDAVFPYGTYAMRVQHGAPVDDVASTDGRVVNAPGSLERRGDACAREERRTLNRALRREAAAVNVEELEDSLADRLADSASETVDRRRASSVVLANAAVSGRDEAGTAPPSERSKLIVTRHSTATARRRRRETQRRRAEEPLESRAHVTSSEHPDPDPPPH